MLHMATNLISEHGDMWLHFISIVSVLCGMSVLVFINPIASILSLIGLFISISAYLILIGYHFFALVYLVVYIGAISILFLFIIMLISVRSSELEHLTTLNSLPLAICAILALNYPLFVFSDYNLSIPTSTAKQKKSREASYRVSGPQWDGNLSPGDSISTLGSVMYLDYNIWLFLASFILLLAMVGCIVITKKNQLQNI
jgi:NADH-ubiquinone oxidoreductase chain 6